MQPKTIKITLNFVKHNEKARKGKVNCDNLVVSTESRVSLLPLSADIDLLKNILAKLSNLALTKGDFSECSD